MKKGILALLCAGAIALTGCYGSYAVFNKVHKWNGTFGNKWATKTAPSLCSTRHPRVKPRISLSSAMKTSSVLSMPMATSLLSTKSKSNQFIDLVFGRSLEIPEGVFFVSP